MELHVFCVYGDCNFVCKLADLPSHVSQCKVRCNKCGAIIYRRAAIAHLRQCYGALPTEGTTASAAEVPTDGSP
ncbi:hypothetical protein MRX96_048192 [Rhipicephalus microplus]